MAAIWHIFHLSLKAHFQHFRSSHVALSDSNFYSPLASLKSEALAAERREPECHVSASSEMLRQRLIRQGCRINFFCQSEDNSLRLYSLSQRSHLAKLIRDNWPFFLIESEKNGHSGVHLKNNVRSPC